MLDYAARDAGSSGAALPRAFLQIAGAPVAWHQLAMALAVGCQKVLCHAREMSSDLVALQHSTEAAGAQFAVVTAARQLAGLISAGDEVFVFSDGLLAPPQVLAGLLDAGQTVLVQPDEPAIAQGFERIDINHATAGAMRIPGRLVEGLADLPADCDVVSSLTRIALQAGVAQTPLPAAAREDHAWLLVRGEGDAHAAEVAWIDRTLQRDTAATPGAALARLGVRTFAPALLHGGSGGNAVATGAGATLFMALVAGWFGFGAIALLLLGAAWIVRYGAKLVMQVARSRPSRLPRFAIFAVMIDAALVLLATWADAPPAGADWGHAALVPVLFVCLLRILAGSFERRWIGLLEDRATLCLVLALPAAVSLLPEAVHLLTLLAGLGGAILAAAGARITRA